MTTAMSMTEAIKEARNRVVMYKCGDGWRVDVYCAAQKVWITSRDMNYSAAAAVAKLDKAMFALRLMHIKPDPAQMMGKTRGPWEDMVRAQVQA